MHKFLPGARALPEHTQHRARSRAGGRLSNSSHDHAQMRTLHHHRHAARLQDLLDRHGNLLRQPLLQLQPPREHLRDPRELGEAEDLAVGNVADVHTAGERDEVVLAHGEDLDILHDNYFFPSAQASLGCCAGAGHTELVVVFLKNGIVDNLLKVLLIPLREVQHRLRIAQRRIAQTLTVGVLANTLQKCPDAGSEVSTRARTNRSGEKKYSRSGKLVQPGGGLVRGGLETGLGTQT